MSLNILSVDVRYLPLAEWVRIALALNVETKTWRGEQCDAINGLGLSTKVSE